MRLRREYFGALAWRPGHPEVHRLDELAVAAALYHLYPRCRDLGSSGREALGWLFGATGEQWQQACASLQQHRLLESRQGVPSERDGRGDLVRVRDFLDSSRPTRDIAKPFWVHVQPFSRCNQRCVHCYCDGSPSASPLRLSLDTWHEIIERLDTYGVLEVYVTGGETFAFPEFFDIAQSIVDRGLGFGLSTNATVASEAVLARLSSLSIRKIQVSLDGATEATHDFIRGTRGGFRRFQRGLERLATVCQPVINTVVSRWNLNELEAIVVLGKRTGCVEFKFFPQKPVGRSLLFRDQCLTDEEIHGTLIPLCARLEQIHAVKIETVDTGAACGSGQTGFAVDELGDMYPCIFGVRNSAQRCGNVLHEDLDTLWFNSPVLERFRATKGVSPICRSCERP